MKYFLKHTKFILFKIFLLYGCQQPNDIGDIEFSNSILFNLIVNQKEQEIYIYRSTLNNNSNDFENFPEYFVDNAIISLDGNNFSYNKFKIANAHQSGFLSKGNFYTNTEDFILVPKTSYSIAISINDLNITGSTHSPDDFEILSPKQNAIVNLQSIFNEAKLHLSWSKSSSAKGYIGKVIQPYLATYPDTSFMSVRESSFITQDTSFIFSAGGYRKGDAEIIILAYDQNLHNHYFENIPSAGVEGAYGYFGSSVLKKVIINFK